MSVHVWFAQDWTVIATFTAVTTQYGMVCKVLLSIIQLCFTISGLIVKLAVIWPGVKGHRLSRNLSSMRVAATLSHAFNVHVCSLSFQMADPMPFLSLRGYAWNSFSLYLITFRLKYTSNQGQS